MDWITDLTPTKEMFNFDTGKFDSLETIPDDEEKLLPYLPKTPSGIRILFQIYILTGMTPFDAYLKAMKILAEERYD